MSYNVKPKLDGAGSTFPKVGAYAVPGDTWVRPGDNNDFIEIGPPSGNGGEDDIQSAGLALYTFKGSPDIPTLIKETCIGSRSDQIYVRWPDWTKGEWVRLADCGALGGQGKRNVELKIYGFDPTGSPTRLPPVIDGSKEYNMVYFRNVAMTRVLTNDYDNGQYPENILHPSRACIEENNGQRWAVLRLVGQNNSGVPTFHLLVKEVQKTINGKGYSPSEGCVIVGSFVGTQLGPSEFRDYTAISGELRQCKIFVCGQSAATVLDFIDYDKSNTYGLGNGSGTRIITDVDPDGRKAIKTEFVSSTTPDYNTRYYPEIGCMMQNPWPNQQVTCESGFFVAFKGYGVICSTTLGRAAIELSSGGDKNYHLNVLGTFFTKDVTLDDLTDDMIKAYSPASSGGLWARYFCGSGGIYDEAMAKCFIPFESHMLDEAICTNVKDLSRVGVYVDDSGNIVAVRTGEVLGDVVIGDSGTSNFYRYIKSRTHDTWVDGGTDGEREHTLFGDPRLKCVVFGYHSSEISGVGNTEFDAYTPFVHKTQFGERGDICDGFSCGSAITTIKTVYICTGDEGVSVQDATEKGMDTVTIYSGSRNAHIATFVLPENVSICSTLTTCNQIAVSINLDNVFKKEDGVYVRGQAADFSIPLHIEQDQQDKEKGIYYPDPSKKGTQTRWIPFKTTTEKLGLIGS